LFAFLSISFQKITMQKFYFCILVLSKRVFLNKQGLFKKEPFLKRKESTKKNNIFLYQSTAQKWHKIIILCHFCDIFKTRCKNLVFA